MKPRNNMTSKPWLTWKEMESLYDSTNTYVVDGETRKPYLSGELIEFREELIRRKIRQSETEGKNIKIAEAINYVDSRLIRMREITDDGPRLIHPDAVAMMEREGLIKAIQREEGKSEWASDMLKTPKVGSHDQDRDTNRGGSYKR